VIRRRWLAVYAAVGAAMAAVLAAADGSRGFRGTGAAWAVCLVPLVFPWRSRRVADATTASKIGGGWGTLHVGEMLFRLGWTLGAGAGLYHRFGDDLGVGFWIALLVFYQTVLAARTAGRLAHDGEPTTDAPG
jgi:hypothetical protein